MREDTTTPKGCDRCGLKGLKMPSVQPPGEPGRQRMRYNWLWQARTPAGISRTVEKSPENLSISGNPRRRLGSESKPARLTRTALDATHISWTHRPAVT